MGKKKGSRLNTHNEPNTSTGPSRPGSFMQPAPDPFDPLRCLMDTVQSGESTATSAEVQNDHPRLTPTPSGRSSAGQPVAPRADTGPHDGTLTGQTYSGKGKQKPAEEAEQSTIISHSPPLNGSIIECQDDGPRGAVLQQGSASGASGNGSEKTAQKKPKKRSKKNQNRDKKSKEPLGSLLQSAPAQPQTSDQDNHQLSSPTGVSTPNTTTPAARETGKDMRIELQKTKRRDKVSTAHGGIESVRMSPARIVVTRSDTPQLGTHLGGLPVAPLLVAKSPDHKDAAKERRMKLKKNEVKQTLNPQEKHGSTVSPSSGCAATPKKVEPERLNPENVKVNSKHPKPSWTGDSSSEDLSKALVPSREASGPGSHHEDSFLHINDDKNLRNVLFQSKKKVNWAHPKQWAPNSALDDELKARLGGLKSKHDIQVGHVVKNILDIMSAFQALGEKLNALVEVATQLG